MPELPEVQALAADLGSRLRGRLLAQRPFWLTLQRVSPDGRMLGGIGTDDPGNTWLWTARLQTVCANAP